MTQITGHAEFCELFLDDVVVPKENLLGERGDGWKIAMHTLGARARDRRASPSGEAPDVARPGRARGRRRELDGAPLLEDPPTQVALARALIGIEVLRHHAYRTVGEFLNGGAVGPDSSSVKLLMAEAEQRLAATALEVLGDARARRPGGGGERLLVGDATSTRARRASTAARSRSSATSSPTASSRCPRSRPWTSS